MTEENRFCLMIGGIREDYCITHTGRAISGELGGNAIYAAVGARLWSSRVSILARVGRNFPLEKLHRLDQVGISTTAVRILDQDLDNRTFYAYRTLEERVDTNPPAHYARWGLPLPEALKGYRSSTEGQDDRERLHPATVRPIDIPEGYLSNISGAHLSPADFLTHLTLPATLQQHGVRVITLDPSIRYMGPSFQNDLPNVLLGLTAFLPSLYEASEFASTQRDDIWGLTELFHSMGPALVAIKAGADGQYLSDAGENKRWHIPAYPARAVDVTGAGDAFCGAFLTGLLETQDPLEATIRGNIAASFVIEGSGALYALETPARLLAARREELKGMVRKE
jgi:sugar/nucleoside kinase (ribokinase family)